MGYGVYMLFATLMILSIFYVYVSGGCYETDGLARNGSQLTDTVNNPRQFIVPETKGIPLERMNELFGPGYQTMEGIWHHYGTPEGRARRDAETQAQVQAEVQAKHDDNAARIGNSLDGKAEEAQIESV
jgi:hypothetical protein